MAGSLVLLELVEDAAEGDDGVVELDRGAPRRPGRGARRARRARRAPAAPRTRCSRMRASSGYCSSGGVDAIEVGRAPRCRGPRRRARSGRSPRPSATSPSSSSKTRARRLPIEVWTALSACETEHVGVGVGEQLPAAVGGAGEALDLLERLLVGRVLLERAQT